MSRTSAAAVNLLAHPCLPAGMTLSHLIELLERVGPHLGLGARRREALMRLIRQTAAADWTAPDRDPVCFRPQQDLAQDLGITDRAMRAHEHALAEMGLAIIDTTANGRRSGRVLPGGRRLGINFRPLIEQIGWMIDLDGEHQAEIRRMATLRLECSAAKRDARQAIDRLIEADPCHAQLPDFLQCLAAWPRRYGAFRSTSELEAHLGEINELVDQISGILSCLHDSSGRAESRIPAILNTTPKILDFCSGSSAKNDRPARERADDNHSAVGPDGPSDCAEKYDCRPGQGRKPELNEVFTPDQLYTMASDDMRLYFDSFGKSPGDLTERDFVRAAIASLVDLGIRPSAWDEAAETMGNLAAALAVLVIDANRFRAAEPVRQPGAMLCAMTKIAQRGGLNLHGSLIRLKQWKIYKKSNR